ncbi:cytochrome c oxidase assembly protein [Saliniramus sp.]|uniref:cytochrome c oxidase assembly protein n=1 Tax=Saliniramus sp. TaxID=2986772 RepID=UPI002C84D12E|nr:cytochrome c oxidase assembly protein [Saliniramus sp.]HMB10077.1 cytochrome c oxidase assembly protein [Saliniramus sp.]
MTQHNHSPAQKQAMRKTVVTCLGVVFGMVGLAYASVPLYDLFCRVTGFGGTPMVGTADAGTVLEETVRVRFDSNVARALPWEFDAERSVVQTQIGQTETVFYRVANMAAQPVDGMATFNVSPEKAAQYFVKLQCFCFEENTLQAGEVMDSAVVFYVDPAIVEDSDFESMRTITLSYTYWPAAGGDPITTSALDNTR